MGDGKSSDSGEEVLRRLSDMVEDDLSQLQLVSESHSQIRFKDVPSLSVPTESICLGSGPSSAQPDAWVLKQWLQYP